MKNKKFKLFASLTSLVMVVAVMAVGVWAATSATIGVTGSVGFTAAEHVRADVVVSGLNVANATITESTKGADFAGKTIQLNGNEPGTNHTGSVAFGDLTIASITDQNQKVVISYTITVTNTDASSDFAEKLQVTVTNTGDATVKVGDADANGVAKSLAYTTSKTVTYTISYEFNPANSISGTADFGVNVVLDFVD